MLFWSGLVIFIGSYVQGLLGFGLSLVSVSLLSLFMGIKTAIPLAGIFGWLVTIPISWRMREFIVYKDGFILLLSSIPGVFCGTYFLAILSKEVILLFIGVSLFITGVYGLFFNKGRRNLLNSFLWSLPFGFVSGILGGIVGTPGVSIIVYFSFKLWKTEQVKATLVFFFMLQMISTLVGFYIQGIITLEVIKYALFLSPGFVLGLICGMISFSALSRSKVNYNKIVYTFLIVMSLKQIWSSGFIF